MQLYTSKRRAEAGAADTPTAQQHGSGRPRFEIQAKLSIFLSFWARFVCSAGWDHDIPTTQSPRRCKARGLEGLRLCFPETGLIKPWASACVLCASNRTVALTWLQFARQHLNLEDHRILAVAIDMHLAHCHGPKQVIRRCGS